MFFYKDAEEKSFDSYHNDFDNEKTQAEEVAKIQHLSIQIPCENHLRDQVDNEEQDIADFFSIAKEIQQHAFDQQCKCNADDREEDRAKGHFALCKSQSFSIERIEIIVCSVLRQRDAIFDPIRTNEEFIICIAAH